jgi:hypothetical protein
MNHYKYLKLLSSAILVGGISVVAAESAKPFSNFYVGVGTGYSMMNGISRMDVSGLFPISNKKSLHSHAIIGKIFAGYEILSASHVYGALEGYFLLDSQSADYQFNDGQSISEKLSRKTALGFRAKLGGALTETVILYGLLGAERSQFSLKGDLGLSGKQSLWAITPGIGASFILSEKTKMSLEISRSCYKAFKIVSPTGSASTRIKPAVNTVAISIALSI